ncbi:hypothetical protein FC093_11805 [Ilyomonas limi]|uniref:Uncharacterized protein n=1 Tax=Ilyomonas limi TaxID=2575867 RepID=A0A4U3L0G5_9BACT|nr:hypothetical protein [Ilyomonas limi]TKK68310.1 hypothetical protein FC093_11805 [Ilyomonas limi]
MKKLALFLGLILILSSFACNKDKMDANAQIRIINKTALPLTDVVVGDANFGEIAPFQTTVYHNFNNLSSYAPPKLTFYNDKILVEYFIGYCGTPPLPKPSYLQGTFTYTITRNNTNAQGFGFSFTQD